MTERNYALLWANGTNFHDLMRLHAHDLAEKIRATEQEDADICTCWNAAADLIDPEVNQ